MRLSNLSDRVENRLLWFVSVLLALAGLVGLPALSTYFASLAQPIIVPTWVPIAAALGIVAVACLLALLGQVYLKAEIRAARQNFCEGLQRACAALVTTDRYPGDSVRVSVFAVREVDGGLVLIGRYPLPASGKLPHIAYLPGEGTSGVCAVTRDEVVVENLPDWAVDQAGHVAALAPYNITPSAVAAFRRKSRCYYAFPVMLRTSRRHAKVVSYVVSIDSLDVAIAVNSGDSKPIRRVVRALIDTNKHSLDRRVPWA